MTQTELYCPACRTIGEEVILAGRKLLACKNHDCRTVYFSKK